MVSAMFIRRTQTRRTEDGKPYFSHRLVHAERLGSSVRQRTLLNLGRHFDIPQADWPLLCARINDALSGQAPLVADCPPAVEEEAQRIAAQLIARSTTASRRGPTATCSSPSSPTNSCRSSALGCARTANTPGGPRYAASSKASSASPPPSAGPTTHAACTHGNPRRTRSAGHLRRARRRPTSRRRPQDARLTDRFPGSYAFVVPLGHFCQRKPLILKWFSFVVGKLGLTFRRRRVARPRREIPPRRCARSSRHGPALAVRIAATRAADLDILPDVHSTPTRDRLCSSRRGTERPHSVDCRATPRRAGRRPSPAADRFVQRPTDDSMYRSRRSPPGGGGLPVDCGRAGARSRGTLRRGDFAHGRGAARRCAWRGALAGWRVGFSPETEMMHTMWRLGK